MQKKRIFLSKKHPYAYENQSLKVKMCIIVLNTNLFMRFTSLPDHSHAPSRAMRSGKVTLTREPEFQIFSGRPKSDQFGSKKNIRQSEVP